MFLGKSVGVYVKSHSHTQPWPLGREVMTLNSSPYPAETKGIRKIASECAPKVTWEIHPAGEPRCLQDTLNHQPNSFIPNQRQHSFYGRNSSCEKHVCMTWEGRKIIILIANIYIWPETVLRSSFILAYLLLITVLWRSITVIQFIDGEPERS